MAYETCIVQGRYAFSRGPGWLGPIRAVPNPLVQMLLQGLASHEGSVQQAAFARLGHVSLLTVGCLKRATVRGCIGRWAGQRHSPMASKLAT